MLHLTFIGDIFPGDELFTEGFGIRSKTGEKTAGKWALEIVAVTGSADFIVGNLESPLTEEDGLFCGKPRFADILKEAGVNVLNIANNHILEHGAAGLEDTLSTLRKRGIGVTGLDGADSILILEKDGIRISMAGFCDERICSIPNDGGSCHSESASCHSERSEGIQYASLDEKHALEALERMKAAGADLIVFLFHWGNEYVHIPSPDQRALARKLIDGGADLIVGHHPHVIQPYEKYGNGHILYSLGNFCFDDVQSAHFGKGLVATVSVTKEGIKEIAFSGVKVRDMAYGDSLVGAMKARPFARCFSRINRRYDALGSLPDEAYRKRYESVLRRAHSRERIRMRLALGWKVLDIRHRHKRQLLRNIKHYLFG